MKRAKTIGLLVVAMATKKKMYGNEKTNDVLAFKSGCF